MRRAYIRAIAATVAAQRRAPLQRTGAAGRTNGAARSRGCHQRGAQAVWRGSQVDGGEYEFSQ